MRGFGIIRTKIFEHPNVFVVAVVQDYHAPFLGGFGNKHHHILLMYYTSPLSCFAMFFANTVALFLQKEYTIVKILLIYAKI
jgi:hypothetical protein